LQWRLHTLLTRDAAAIPDLPTTLASADAPQRYLLAGQLARSYADYARYRSDWLPAWEQAAPHWQAHLWAALRRTQPGTRLAGQVLTELLAQLTVAHLPATAQLPTRIILFGFSSLAPLELAVIQALSQHIEVYLLSLSPCQEYWSDLRSARQLARQLTQGDPAAQHHTEGHRLLAAWGGQSREFLELLLTYDNDPVQDYATPDESTLLGQLQADLLYLRPDDPRPKRALAPTDRSLQIHSTHSEMRELEVLHDQLLHLFSEQPDLTPGDVAVLIPALDTYAPYIEAVFGHAPVSRYIPYSLVDRSHHYLRPLSQGFVQLLARLPSRWELSTVLDLLEIPAVQRRFGLTADELPRIHHWLTQTHTRWGVDAAQRAALGLPATDEHSFTIAIRRLLLGFALPKPNELYHGIAPHPAVEGQDASVLGKLAYLLETLFQLDAWVSSAQTLTAWSTALLALGQCLFLPDPLLPREMDDYAQLRAACAALAAAEADCPLSIELSVVVQALQASLDQAATVPFLQGQVNFCALTPARALPFKVIALLGLNHGAFPRIVHRAEFDLLATAKYRLGDLSRSRDDRALCLQIVHSARRCLYLSFLGRDPRDDSLRPPSVLLSELQETLAEGYTPTTQLITEHPLQPFHPRYFQPGTPDALPSYAKEWLSASKSHTSTRAAALDYDAAALPVPALTSLSLDTLLAFWQHPSRGFLRDGLGAKLLGLEDANTDAEPFDLDAREQSYLFASLWALTPRPDGLAAWQQCLPWLRAQSQLPHGTPGDARWGLLADELATFQTRLSTTLGTTLPAQQFHFTLGGVELHGSLRQLYQGGVGHYAWAQPRAKHRLALWLDHLVWQLVDGANLPAVRQSHWLGKVQSFHFQALSRETAQQCLLDLILGYQLGQTYPLAFFPDTSYAYQAKVATDAGKAWGDACQRWQPSFRPGQAAFPGEQQDAYRRMLWGEACELRQFQPEFERWAAQIYAPLCSAQKGDAGQDSA
jgi:exodeoxyribonuclease V gamma subunit